MEHDDYGLKINEPTHNPAVRSAVDGHVDPSAEFIPDVEHLPGAIALLRTTQTIRDRATALLARARRGESVWFLVGDEAALEDAAREVVEVTRERYPWHAVPYHSRWRHFETGEIDRLKQLDTLLGPLITPVERTRALIDLVLVSVLLDAGAGPDWHYLEPATHLPLSRSEGLAVASFHAFTSGLFSSNPDRPLQADAAGLRALITDHLGAAMQVSEVNLLVGLADRATLLRRLGETMAEQPEIFGEDGRPGGLFDALISPFGPAIPPTAEVGVHAILTLVLESLSRIWPAANYLGSGSDPGSALGDCWRHSAVLGPGLTNGWMPFHKLSQWLTYSLVEPFEWAGVKVYGLDVLTGLPEYRNGGLLLDTRVLIPRDPVWLQHRWRMGDEFIVEWRALTVALLDELAPVVRKLLGRTADALPPRHLFEAGTWAAGRALAQRLRGGESPLQIERDGTVF